ncbi:MAG: hypothetical protein FWF30_01580 [Coriobacteriia bacterium]|nr:hypothetical protein [Coriobacteriia bacterium]
MRIILISGFLGSGKTSLLIQMMDYLTRQSPSPRIVIIENEIGSINLDSRMLDGKGLTMREMLSGCICCSLLSNLASEITHTAQTLAPDLLIIEATGMANARDVITGIHTSVDESLYSSVQSIVIVDASRLPYLLERTPRMVSRQLEQLDAVLLNKTDLVLPEELGDVRAALREVVPDARVIEVSAENGVSDESWAEALLQTETGAE